MMNESGSHPHEYDSPGIRAQDGMSLQDHESGSQPESEYVAGPDSGMVPVFADTPPDEMKDENASNESTPTSTWWPHCSPTQGAGFVGLTLAQRQANTTDFGSTFPRRSRLPPGNFVIQQHENLWWRSHELKCGNECVIAKGNHQAIYFLIINEWKNIDDSVHKIVVSPVH